MAYRAFLTLFVFHQFKMGLKHDFLTFITESYLVLFLMI
jgi:hypothetical protein